MIPASRKRSSSLRRFFSPPRLANAIRAVTFTPLSAAAFSADLDVLAIEAKDGNLHAFLGALDGGQQRRHTVGGLDDQFHDRISPDLSLSGASLRSGWHSFAVKTTTGASRAARPKDHSASSSAILLRTVSA